MAGIVVLYHFLFSSFEYIVYMFKTGEQKVIQENDSCHIIFHICISNTKILQNISRKIYIGVSHQWGLVRQGLIMNYAQNFGI
jgi:hypothetical protein